jgi:predicted ester cyclase
MTSIESTNLSRAVEWIRAVERGTTGDQLAEFLTSDAVHEDMPNRVFPNGMRYDLAGMRAAAERGNALLPRQRYDILSAIASGNSVAIQLDWSGELAVPYGSLKPGDELKAHIAIFMEFRDGKICHQRDYGCYEPF